MTDDDHIWTTVRARADELFGEPPGNELEQDIIDIWQRAPLMVERRIEQIGGRVAAGTVHSGWPVLRKAVQGQPLEATATTGNELAKAEKRALNWIRNAGLHYDRQDELEDTLFGDHGFGERGENLRDWAHDQPLRQRMLTAWKAARPYAENTEHDAEARAARWVAAIERTRAAKAAKLKEATA